jgi:predicted O-methyltransferase YrrM
MTQRASVDGVMDKFTGTTICATPEGRDSLDDDGTNNPSWYVPKMATDVGQSHYQRTNDQAERWCKVSDVSTETFLEKEAAGHHDDSRQEDENGEGALGVASTAGTVFDPVASAKSDRASSASTHDAKLPHYATRNHFMRAMRTHGGRMLEIGTFDGDFANANIIHLTPDQEYYMIDIAVRPKLKVRLDDWQNDARIHFIKKTSIEAAKTFPDGHFDVVYIDACHSKKCVQDDIEAWLPKVVDGGILAGHDFCVNSKERQMDRYRPLVPYCGKYRNNPKDAALKRVGTEKATQRASVEGQVSQSP